MLLMTDDDDRTWFCNQEHFTMIRKHFVYAEHEKDKA